MSRVVVAAVATAQHASLTPTDGIGGLTAGVSAALGGTDVRQLMIEGGSTASAIIRACGWIRLRVTAIFADGVVGLQAADGSSPQLVVKPGSYHWPDCLWQNAGAKAV